MASLAGNGLRLERIQAGESSPACILVMLPVLVLRELEENRCGKLQLATIR
jgi:hypothetical protein